MLTFSRMDDAEKHQLLESLEKEAELVRSELSSFAKKDVSNPDNFLVVVEENDRDSEGNASDLAEYEKLIALKDTLVQRLNEIKLAIGKIKEGKYGDCEVCSSPIQPTRLKVMPVARYCIDCAKTKLREA